MTLETPQLVVGNWKMNGDVVLLDALAQALGGGGLRHRAVICPPATLLAEAHRRLSPLGVEVGGQDCHAAASGAHTGGVSAGLLAEAGATHVILGHSERRREHGEPYGLVRRKADAAVAAGLCPIICVGDSAEDRAAGRAIEVVIAQVRAVWSSQLACSSWALAYEPVWAIGAGQAASISDITQMHLALQEALSTLCDRQPQILYGGSVNVENAQGILESPGVGGLLIGGAALQPSAFAGIARLSAKRRERAAAPK